MTMPVPRREASLRNNLLDPQLGLKIKTEPNSRPSTPGLLPFYEPMDGHGAYVPTMHGWGQMPYGPSPSQVDTSNSYASDADDDEEDDDDASSRGYLPARRHRRRKVSNGNHSWPGSMAGSMGYLGDDQDPIDVPNDMARLKGDIWPGMDIFDSATPEMRRKRNQKKATSVIVQLQATSETVTPTELIFDNAGQFKKERVISGEPNSADSPLRGETTPEPDELPVKKRATTRRRTRAPLTDKDPNGGRNLRSSRRTGSHHPPFGKGRAQYVDGSDDLDDDDGLTYGQRRPMQRRSGLSIHRDNTGPDITFDRPSRMNYLTSSFPGPFPSSQPVARTARQGYGHPSDQGGYFQQLPQPYGHQSRPSTGFRAAEPQPLPARDLSAFGALTNQSMFQTSHDFSAPITGNNALPGLQQFGSTGNMGGTTRPFVPDVGLQMHNWDVFGLGNDASFGTLDLNFGNSNDTNGANPLFFETTAGITGEDDEGTISAPASERSAK